MGEAGNIRAALAASRARFDAAIADLSPIQLEEVPAVGTWPIRDVVAHLIDWHAELLRAAEHGLGGAAPAGHPIADDDYNERSVARHAGESWAQLAAGLGAAFDHAAALAGDGAADRLGAPTTFPWGGAGTVEGMLAAIVEHQEEHTAQLEAWRASGVVA